MPAAGSASCPQPASQARPGCPGGRPASDTGRAPRPPGPPLKELWGRGAVGQTEGPEVQPRGRQARRWRAPHPQTPFSASQQGADAGAAAVSPFPPPPLTSRPRNGSSAPQPPHARPPAPTRARTHLAGRKRAGRGQLRWAGPGCGRGPVEEGGATGRKWRYRCRPVAVKVLKQSQLENVIRARNAASLSAQVIQRICAREKNTPFFETDRK